MYVTQMGPSVETLASARSFRLDGITLSVEPMVSLILTLAHILTTSCKGCSQRKPSDNKVPDLLSLPHTMLSWQTLKSVLIQLQQITRIMCWAYRELCSVSIAELSRCC